ncbi:MAG: hypothetical protein II309_02385 [Bacilli bacterium]|nr:hypothetical protein [Bacilli bacterium]
MLKITKKQKQIMEENAWAYELVKKVENKKGQEISSISVNIMYDYFNSSMRKNKDTLVDYVGNQFRRENKFSYEEYQRLMDIVLLGK